MKKIIILVFFIFLTGCTEDYSKSDIKDYVDDQLNIAGFIVSSDSYSRKEDDEYEDYIWSVTLHDSGIEFHVIDDYCWGLEWVSNYLWNDYDGAIMNTIYDNLNVSDILEISTNQDEDGIYTASINETFSNLEQLEESYDELLL